MNRQILLVLTVILCSTSSSAQALGIFSRACSVSEVTQKSRTLSNAALIFFELIGDANMGSLTPILEKPLSDQDQYKIFESITADYAEVRYYLFAKNEVYRQQANPNSEIRGPDPYFKVAGYNSHWSATDVHPDLVNDPRLIFLHNRSYLYSARAGDPNIVRYWPRLDFRYRDFFKVVGQHYYYSPTEKLLRNLGRTEANDCNFQQWGFENR